ncbi:MAG: hypothetical protein HY670_11440 [Chloroflexi bacterium]|nr:hypothetical protein [Chloroflexota bacterium]
MIYWAQLFHFYQPPTQIPAVLEKICNESYKPLLEVFRQHPHARATVNINGVLLEMLRDHGHRDIINGLRELGERAQIEFTGSGKYHPILPLLPSNEVRRQIELNIVASRRALGKGYMPRGFFPPEMCYGPDIVPEIIATGHRWLILGGVACPCQWPMDRICQVEYGGKKLAVFFRDDVLSNKISFRKIGPRDFIGHLKQLNGSRDDTYIVTAMDAETYGHHIRGWERLFLSSVYEQIQPGAESYGSIKQATALAAQQSALLESAEFANQVKIVTISELLNLFPAGDTISPKLSSWSTMDDDLKASNPYPLWKDKDNEIHRLQWEHLNLCIDVVGKAQECAANEESALFARIARGLLDLAEHSCQFWWASHRPMWDINLIHLGLIEQWRVLVNAYRAINKSPAAQEIKRDYYYKLVAARDIRNKIVDKLFIE